MQYFRLRLLICLMITIVVINSKPAKAEEVKFNFMVGEEFAYKVRWSFIRLGTLKLVVKDTSRIDGELVYHTQLFIDSNPLLFFVNMHNVYNSYLDEKFRLRLFTAEERIDDILYETVYKFNYQDSTIKATYTNIENPEEVLQKEMSIDELLLDGSSLIFYARSRVHNEITESLTTFFEAKKGKVQINFKGKGGNQRISSFEDPIETYYVDGVMDATGIAGITGPFKGWFSTDRQRPPVKAKLKVFIGYVTVDLENWKKWDFIEK